MQDVTVADAADPPFLVCSALSMGCGGAVVPVVDSSMIPTTTQMRALAGGVAWQGLFYKSR
jgi:hypothetical protein